MFEATLEDKDRWQHEESRKIEHIDITGQIESLKNDALHCFEVEPEFPVGRIHVMLDGWRLCCFSAIYVTMRKENGWTKELRYSLPQHEDSDKQKQVENLVHSACKLFDIVLPVHETLTAAQW